MIISRRVIKIRKILIDVLNIYSPILKRPVPIHPYRNSQFGGKNIKMLSDFSGIKPASALLSELIMMHT